MTRSDGSVSERVRAIAILHKDPVAIVTTRTKIAGYGDLKDKILGIVGPPGANDALIAALQHHYHTSNEIRAIPPTPGEISSAIRAKLVDALLFVAPTAHGAKAGEGWTMILRSNRRQLKFVSIDDAEAIAEASPAYEAGEIAAGQFGGAPAIPDESVTTLEVATYLAADRDVSDDNVTLLAHKLFEERQKISAEASIANAVQAASTERDAILPIHPGAKVYFDSEETTLIERYGDWLFYGPMLLGALGSVSVGALRFLGVNQGPEVPLLVSQVEDVIRSIRSARRISELATIRADVDAAIGRLATELAKGRVDETRTGVVALVLYYIDRALSERNTALLREGVDGSPAQAKPSIETSRLEPDGPSGSLDS